MLAVLLAVAAQGQVPVGAYAMSGLCSELTKASGVQHSAVVRMLKYPVFVSVKSGDPDRVRSLVAVALGGEWKKDEAGYTLTYKKPEAAEDFEEFSREMKEHGAELQGASIAELHRLAPGRSIRFGKETNAYVLPWSNDIPAGPEGANTPTRLVVHRMAGGIFARSDNGQVQFEGLPKKVEELLGKDLAKKALTGEQIMKAAVFIRDPASAKSMIANLTKKDPAVAIAEMVLPFVAEAIQPDMAVALPDFTLAALIGAQGAGTVKDCLSPYSMEIVWDVKDGALIGKLPYCERLLCTQADRAVLRRFAASAGADGVIDTPVMGAYVAAQTPAASDAWTDAMYLAMSGLPIDQEYIADYPYNLRLYAGLTKAHWDAMRSGRTVPATALSVAAQSRLLELLIHAAGRTGGTEHFVGVVGDPAWWPSLGMPNLALRAEFVDEPVLVTWRDGPPDVATVRSAAMNHKFRSAGTKKEPLYQPAHREKMKLIVMSSDGVHSVETGFSAVTPDKAVKPCPWQKLPAAVMKEFKDAMEGLPPADVAPADVGGN